MCKKIIISVLASIFLSLFLVTDAVQVFIPREGSDDPDYNIGESSTLTWSRSVTDIISLVNSYLWFAIGLVCFLFMIWNGYQLIMARGDGKQMTSAKSALIWSAFWLAVCLLAYVIVNIAIKLFA